ncbi:unnamed protein product, partial [Prorocentrum cordatum]
AQGSRQAQAHRSSTAAQRFDTARTIRRRAPLAAAWVMAARGYRAVADGRVVALQEHEVATKPVACGITSFSELWSSIGACWDSADIAGSVFFDYYPDLDAAVERHLTGFDGDKGGTQSAAVEPELVGRALQESHSPRSDSGYSGSSSEQSVDIPF